MRNHEYWLEVESLAPFTPGHPNTEICWHWLEKLQSVNRGLRQHDLIILKALLDNVYKAGNQKGYEEGANYVDR